MNVAIPLAQAHAKVGEALFVSPWTEVDSQHLAQFAWSTYLDPEHTDLTVSKNNPLGADLIDGFLLLSLLTSIHFNHSPLRADGLYGLNYGTDRVRFTSPVFLGQQIRCVCVVDSVQERPDDRMLITTTNTIEIQGQDKPAMVATWVSLYVPGTSS